MSGFAQWFRKPTTAERLARFALRPDTVAAAEVMVFDRQTDDQIAALESSLTETETILRMLGGRYRRDHGLLVLTDQRVFFRSRQSRGLVAFSVRLAELDRIEGSTRRVVGTVRVTSPDGEFVVDDILGTQGEMLAAEAEAARRGDARPQQDPLTALAELRALRDRGAITAEEFEARKAALWGDI